MIVYVYVSLCDFVCIDLHLLFVPGFCLFVFILFIIIIIFFVCVYSFKHLLELVDLFFGLVELFFFSFFF